MKKQVMKLVLAKETMGKLESGQLAEAAGGYTGYSCGGYPRICEDVPDSFSCYG
jgi:hypothetical protein